MQTYRSISICRSRSREPSTGDVSDSSGRRGSPVSDERIITHGASIRSAKSEAAVVRHEGVKLLPLSATSSSFSRPSPSVRSLMSVSEEAGDHRPLLIQGTESGQKKKASRTRSVPRERSLEARRKDSPHINADSSLRANFLIGNKSINRSSEESQGKSSGKLKNIRFKSPGFFRKQKTTDSL